MTLGLGRTGEQIDLVSLESQTQSASRVRSALRSHHLVHGVYPVALRELVQRELLHSNDLVAVAGLDWEYRAFERGQRYDLKRGPVPLD
jgi:hypothetical protein